MFLLDTNTVIYYFKGMGNVASRLLATPPREIAISSVTQFELEVGIAKSSAPGKRRRQLDQLVPLIRVIPFGTTEARAAATVRAKLEKRGEPISTWGRVLVPNV